MNEAASRDMSRRKFGRVTIGAGAAIMGVGPEKIVPRNPEKIGLLTAETFAHNSDTDSQIKNSRGMYGIEMDISQLEDGTLVLAHSASDYLRLPESLRMLHDPYKGADMIREQGSVVHADVKRVKKAQTYIDFLHNQQAIAPMMVSTPDHVFLDKLKKSEFKGRILYTLEDSEQADAFIQNHHKDDFSQGLFGVSIKGNAFTYENSKIFKDWNLYRLVWTLNTEDDIAKAINNGAQGITSDKKDLLVKLNENAKLPKAA